MSVIVDLIVRQEHRGMLRCSSNAVLLIAHVATKRSDHNEKSVWSPLATFSVVISSRDDFFGGWLEQNGLCTCVVSTYVVSLTITNYSHAQTAPRRSQECPQAARSTRRCLDR